MQSQNDDAQIIENIEATFCKAIVALDIDAILALYIPDESFHLFDMQLPREYVGADALRKNWEDFVQTDAGAIDECYYEEFELYLSDDLATSHFVQHAKVTDKSGNEIVANTRITHVYRKIDGKWLIVHEHASFPIDWKTGVADRLSRH